MFFVISQYTLKNNKSKYLDISMKNTKIFIKIKIVLNFSQSMLKNYFEILKKNFEINTNSLTIKFALKIKKSHEGFQILYKF